MATKLCYIFDATTFELKSTYEAHESPLEPGIFHFPVHSTVTPPPTVAVNQIPVWDDVLKKWNIVADFRGKVFDQTTGAESQYTTLGALPANLGIAPPPPTFAQIQENKRNDIRMAFSVDSVKNVVVGTGATAVPYSGGYDSAMKLNAAVQLTQLAGLTTVTFYDANNVARTQTIAAAQAVILAVGSAYQTAFARKQTAMVAVDAATTAAAVALITY